MSLQTDDLLALGIREKRNRMGFRDAHLALINNQWTAQQLGDYYQSTAQPITAWTTLIMEYKNAAQEY